MEACFIWIPCLGRWTGNVSLPILFFTQYLLFHAHTSFLYMAFYYKNNGFLFLRLRAKLVRMSREKSTSSESGECLSPRPLYGSMLHLDTVSRQRSVFLLFLLVGDPLDFAQRKRFAKRAFFSFFLFTPFWWQ